MIVLERRTGSDVAVPAIFFFFFRRLPIRLENLPSEWFIVGRLDQSALFDKGSLAAEGGA